MTEYELWAWSREDGWSFVKYVRLSLYQALRHLDLGYGVEEAQRDPSGTLPLFPRLGATEPYQSDRVD